MFENHIYEKFSLFAEIFVNTNALSLDEFNQLVFEAVFSFIPEAEKGSFFLLDNGIFKPMCSKGYDLNLLKQLQFKEESFFIDFESFKDQTIDSYNIRIKQRDVTKFSQKEIDVFKALGTFENLNSLYAPIKFDHKKIGLICLDNFNNQSFSNSSKLLLKIFAQQISNFYTLKIHEKTQKEIYNDIISALVAAIEIKDPYTIGHAKRVAWYCDCISDRLKLSKKQKENIHIAAILHDIGKIGTPSELLNKDGPLTDSEYEIVKNHPLNTKRILEKIQGFDDVIMLATMHHEHYDGSGYPFGLCSSNIPIEAQIIQCSDALDAMTSNRSYRTALSFTTVKQIFLSEKGKQFNPVLVDIIIELFLDPPCI